MKNIIDIFWDYMQNSKDVFIYQLNKENREEVLTYKELNSYIIGLNEIIKEANYDKKIGILIDNDISFVKGFIATIYNGYTLVGIDPKITDEALDKIILDNNLKYIVTNNKNQGKVSNKLVHIINIDNIKPKVISNTNKRYCKPNFEDILVISHTSGTSGKFSKGVKLTNKNISFVSEEYRKIYKLNNTSKIITVLPLWHNYAMFACLTSAMMSGAKLILMKEWNLEKFIKINEKYKPDVFPGSPYMYIDIINNSDKNLTFPSLRICDSGGDSLPIECIKKFEEKTNAIITEGYGLTETTSLTHFNYSAKERKVGSLGKCVSEVECKIKDINGNIINEKSTWGLLWIKGPMVFAGYVNNKELTNEVLMEDGWFNTKDVVKVDDEGYYYIAGRLSDIQKMDDNEKTLREIENTLYKFEGIKRVFIKKKFNKQAKFPYYDIYAELKEDYNKTQLYDYAIKELKDIVIDNIEILDKLPITGTGKVKRNKIGG